MHLFEEIKEQLTVAFCKRCERSGDIQTSGAKLWSEKSRLYWKKCPIVCDGLAGSDGGVTINS